jgi:hypothetical protein
MGKRETCEPKPVPSFIKARSIFHAHNIGECDEQYILNLELALFCLKHISHVYDALNAFLQLSFSHI